MNLTPVLSIIIFSALLMAGAFWLWGRKSKQKSGLPAGEIIYTDSGMWFSNNSPMRSAHLGLVGKPDYLVEEDDGSIIPVELKSGRAPNAPWEGHILQLAAYCMLVEENYGARPSYGIIQYKNRAFAIDYTPELEEDLLDLLAEMRDGRFAGEIDRDHEDWRRCANCGMRGSCYQRLG